MERKKWFFVFMLAVGLVISLHHTYALADPVLKGIIINARWTNGDGFGSWVSVEVHNADEAFTQGVTSITITAPDGEVLPYGKDDFEFTDYGTYYEYWLNSDLSGSPDIGTYTFTIVSNGTTYIGADTQYQNRILPYPDINSFQIEGQTFSWDLVEYEEDIPLYYRFRIYDENGSQLVSTSRYLDMSSYAYEGQLNVGERYRMQMRVCDSGNWYEVQNNARSERWFTFGVEDPFDPVCEISGTVTGTDVDGMHINVFDRESDEHLGWGRVPPDGKYSVKGIGIPPSGEYRVRLDSGDTYNVGENFPDPVSPGDVNIDFSPVQGGKIFGYVSGAYGNLLSNVGVAAFGFGCGDWVNSAGTNDDGAYSVTAPMGTFALRVEPWWNGDLNYASEYWTASGGNADCAQAEGVSVSLGADTRIDFELEPGGVLAGHVMDEAGVPLADVHVYVELEPCTGKWVGGSNTNVDGDFEIKYLPLETPLYVRICPSCSGQNEYSDEWYDGSEGTVDPAQALGVEVVVGEETVLDAMSLDNYSSGCAFNLSRTSIQQNSRKHTEKIFIYASEPDCHWAVADLPPWVEVTPHDGTGDGEVTLTIAPNYGSSRNGTLRLAGKEVQISQGPDTADDFHIILEKNNPVIIEPGVYEHIFGNRNNNEIVLKNGGQVKIFNALGNNLINIESDSTNFMVSRSGATVMLKGENETLLIIAATQSPQSIRFNDRELTLVIQTGRVLLGTQEVGLTPSLVGIP